MRIAERVSQPSGGDVGRADVTMMERQLGDPSPERQLEPTSDGRKLGQLGAPSRAATGPRWFLHLFLRRARSSE